MSEQKPPSDPRVLMQFGAKEACDWLREAGFPQYPQMYEDLLFPIDLTLVQREHDFLDGDCMEALSRRLNVLNKCAAMKLQVPASRKKREDSEEDEPCTISGKWTFQRASRRWARVEDCDAFPPLPSLASWTPAHQALSRPASRKSLPANLRDSEELASFRSLRSSLPIEHSTPRVNCMLSFYSWAPREDGAGPSPVELLSISSSSQGKPAKAKAGVLFQKPQPSHIGPPQTAPSKLGLGPSGPELQEGLAQGKMKHLQYFLSSSQGGSPFGGVCKRRFSFTWTGRRKSESGIEASTPIPGNQTLRLGTSQKRRGVYLEEFNHLHQAAIKRLLEQNPDSCPEDKVHQPGRGRENSAAHWRAGGCQGPGPEGAKGLWWANPPRSASSPLCIYENLPDSSPCKPSGHLPNVEQKDVFPDLDFILLYVNEMQKIVNQWSAKDSASKLDLISPFLFSPKQLHLENNNDLTSPSYLDSVGDSLNKQDEPSGLQERRDFDVGPSLTGSSGGSASSALTQISCQSVAQMNLLRKYSLLKLTALLEKYTPSNQHSFSWLVPKIMKRHKDYKGQRVFGVPLSVNVQRTGQPLPQSIQQAMDYLYDQCLYTVGLFRISGVKSRIQALRQMNESSKAHLSYEGQCAYVVADMLKQYFRDLPEPLITSEVSNTFLYIHQYVPKEQRLQAIQVAIMLLPEENREVLQMVLCFLSKVTAAVKENQMTPTSLALCLAPSLFQLNTLKREKYSSGAMQRKQILGTFDLNDLSKNLAVTQCLAHMIAEYHKLFQVPEEMSHWNSYAEQELHPLSLEALHLRVQDTSDYQHFLQDCIENLFKEAKDFKGWVSHPTSEQAELAYRKVREGPLLRLWKSTIKVPAKAEDVLNRLLKEQHVWDPDLLNAKVIEILDRQTEIYQFVRSSVAPHPARDHVVLRTWRTNLPKGTCMLLLTSVNHAQATVVGVRVNVLLAQYLIEPCGARKSKLTYLCRTDLKGHMPEWYTKAFAHLCVAEVVKIRDSFTCPNLGCKDEKSK